MTVAELIELLKEVEPSRIVIMSRDAEGNGYSPLEGTWKGVYVPDSTWSGDVGLEILTVEDEDAGFTDEDVLSGEPALILCPTN